MEDPHAEFCLLRSCLALPKMMFNLRTVDTTPFLPLLQEFDRITREALVRILGSPVNEQQWHQAKLPVSMGGLGLRAAEDHAPAAYISSLLSSKPLVSQLLSNIQLQNEADEAQAELDAAPIPDHLMEAIKAKLDEETEVTMDFLHGQNQKQLSAAIDLSNQSHLKNQVLADGDKREVARLACLTMPHSGDWLNCPPVVALGLRIPATEFILAVKYRLGMPVFGSNGPCPACNHPSDKFGDHALNCGYSGERITRHNLLRDAIFDVASSAALSPVKEGRFLLPGADRRPADVFIRGWAGGQDAAYDVTVINPLQELTREGAAAKPGHAADVAYQRKMNGAAEDCRAQGIVFLPLAAETFGGWHEVAVVQVKKLASALARHNGQEEGEVAGHIWSRLGVLLQRGNAMMMANRIPSFPAPPTDGRI